MPEPYTIGRHRGCYCLVHYDKEGKRHRQTLGTSDPATAEKLAPILYAEVMRPKGETVEDLWKAYTEDKVGRAVVVTMSYTWRALRDRFAKLPVGVISDADCKAHVQERRSAGIKDGTIHTELGHLRMVLLWAKRKGYIERVPEIERPSKPAPKEEHLTRAEVKALIGAAPTAHIRTFIILAMGTGGRNAALLDLTWDRCDFEREKIDLRNPTINVPHKGRAIVPMNRSVKTTLQEALRGSLSEYVIEWGGRRLKSVKRGLQSAAERAGLKHVTPHMLRHTAAVHMAERGIPMEEIAQFLGHSNVEITRRVYARFSPTHLRHAADVLDYDLSA